MRSFSQVDVFAAAGRLAGNPLAVVIDAEGLTDSEMQAFARWTNLSETTFLLEPSDSRASYRVRIFTPQGEIAFAGHPTLGSCHAWLETCAPGDTSDRFVQECQVGLVELRRTEHGLGFAAPPLHRSGPLGSALTGQIARNLCIRADEIVDGAWVDNGAGWAAVLLRDADAVLALKPNRVQLDIGVVGAHIRDGRDGPDFEVRAFYPKHGMTAEDPVTGSLNAGIAQWLISAGRASAPYQVRQGTAIGHDGRVNVTQEKDGGIWIAGRTTTVISGRVAL